MKRVIVLAASVALLAGCAQASPERADEPSTAPADGGSYGSVAELKDAFVAAGGECDDWSQDNQVSAAAESGVCDSDSVLSTYTSQGARDEIVSTVKALGEGVFDVELLVGENWIINASDASDVRDELGGTLVTADK